ncbi:MAG: acetate kinase [Polaromonas sp.]|nr:acetate kinase [Polaromonas sp.]
MSEALLVVNSGSSSVKFAAYDTGNSGGGADSALARIASGKIEGIGGTPRLLIRGQDGAVLEDRAISLPADLAQAQQQAFGQLFDWLGRHADGRTLGAVGHRVVHGGERFSRPARITPEVLAQLDELTPLAPLHQPHNLSAIRAIAGLLPGLPQVACFDTEFHASQPWVAQAYALPRRITEAGVKHYGFHGLSYEYIASVLPERLGTVGEGRVVAAHLGNGASLCAMQGRRSVASTMGFTALDGLMMGTRCGSLDPGVVLYLMRGLGMSPKAVEKLLYEQSGLLGVSGVSGDMRTVEASETPQARQAIELYLYRIRQQLGSLAASLGGLDALVFTAGIGENSAMIRRRVCIDAAWVGVALDDAANEAPSSAARRISTPASRVAVWVMPTDEELMIARHTLAVLDLL